MSEDWLRRRLEGLSQGEPAAPDGRVSAILGRARRRARLRTTGAALTAVAALLGTTLLIAEDGGPQGLVTASPEPTPAGESPSAGPASSPTPTGTAAPTGTTTPDPSASPGSSAPAPPVTTGGPPADTRPLRLGFLGDVSGTPSSVLPTAADGPAALLQAWAADVNARGGLGGREVQLVIEDAGQDPADRRRAAQRLLDAGVVAVVGSVLSASSRDPGAQLLTDGGVPLVGGDLASAQWGTDPLAFPQGALPAERSEGMLAVLGDAASGDDRDLALVCTDGPACDALEEQVTDGRGEAYGLRGTLVVRVGITETNYGPVVQQLKAARVDLVAVQLVWQQARSLGQEFARQSYAPDAVVVEHDLADELAADRVAAGWWAVSPVFPHVTPDDAADRFRRVGEGLDLGAPEARTWAAAMLLERGVAELGPARVTSPALVRVLRSLRGERLGGLVPPLDLDRRPATRCVLVARVSGATWTTPAGLRPTCLAP